MKIIRKADIKEVFQTWARSESKRFGYPQSLEGFDLQIQHLKNRCYLYGDILFAAPLNCYLVELSKNDIKKCKFLRQVDSKGKEEEPSDINKYITKYPPEGKVLDKNVWSFIAIKRPGKGQMTIMDGLHRFSDWVSQITDKDTGYMVNPIRGYIIETKNKLREFQ